MYTVKPTSKFQKDLKRIQRRGYDVDLLTAVIEKLAAGETLDAGYSDHPLKGKYTGCRECHITPVSSEKPVPARSASSIF